jgi:O-antigen/teichoic acid export membrane protein
MPSIRRTIVFTFLSMIAAGFNYLFYPIAAHLSEVAFFGDLNTLMSILMQGTSLLLALNVVSLFFLNNFSKDEADKQILKLQGISLTFIGIILAISLISTPLITSLIGIKDVASLAIVYISILLLIPSVIWSTYLQAHGQLYAVANFNIIVSVLRVLFCAAALYFDQALWVVMLGLLLAQVAGMAYLYLISKHRPPISFASLSYILDSTHTQLRPFVTYILIATVALFLMGVISNYDVVVVRTLFGDTVAGHYSGVAIFGKAVFFALGTMQWPMLPAIRLAAPRQSRTILLKSLGLMLVAGIVIIGGIALLKDSVLPLLIGKDYIIDQKLLFIICFEQLVAVLLMTYLMYLLVQRKGRALLLTLTCIATIGLLVVLFHQSPTAVSLAFLSGILLGMLFYKGVDSALSLIRNNKSA